MRIALSVLSLGLLANCAGSVSEIDNRSFVETPNPDRLIAISDETLSYMFEDGEVLSLSSEDVEGSLFAVATSADEGTLALFLDEKASAQLILRVVDDIATAETDFARLAPTEMPKTGFATYEGEIIGQNRIDAPVENDQLVNLGADFGTLANRMRSDLTLPIDFIEREIDGEVRNRRSLLLGFPVEFELSEHFNLDLLAADIRNDGSFEGVAQYVQPDPVVDANPSGTYSGLLAGATGEILVGEIVTPSEIGVFAATVTEVSDEILDPKNE